MEDYISFAENYISFAVIDKISHALNVFCA